MELTKKDVTSMIGLIKANYPYAYKDVMKEDMLMLINTWYKCFSKYPKEVVGAAFQKAIQTCKMPPTIADVMENIEAFADATDTTESELWNELVSAINKMREITYFGFQEHYRDGVWINPREEMYKLFGGLNPVLKEYLGDANSLKTLANMDNLEFEKARFFRVLPTIKQRQKIRNEINPDVLMLLNSNDIFKPMLELKDNEE